MDMRKGDHTLWILARSPRCRGNGLAPDAVQEVCAHAGGSACLARLRHRRQPLTALRVYIDGAPAEASDHMPCARPCPALYARVAALKARFDPNDSRLEEMRPMLAARQLLTRVFDASGWRCRTKCSSRCQLAARRACA